jgi:hypothetical protein
VDLVGAWDSNGNWLIDPMDTYGAYAIEGVDSNPIEVSGTDLPGYDIDVPLGDEGFRLIPFVTLRGTITANDGETFDDFFSRHGGDGSSVLYGTALKYLPNGDLDVEDFEDSYDHEIWLPLDWTSQTELTYRLLVPAESIVYLWIWSDVDADGFVNAPGEPAGSPSSSQNGRYVTGTSSMTGLDVTLTDSE